MSIPKQKREWTWSQFRRLYPDTPAEVLRPLMDICNTAIRHGLTRDQVMETFTRLGREYPKELPAAVVVEALQEEIDKPTHKGGTKCLKNTAR